MNIQTFLTNILKFLDSTIVPFLLAVAGLIFIWNAVRYFIIGGDNHKEQEAARSLALWGILAFVIILSLGGVVNLVVKSLNFDNRIITPDYMEDKAPRKNNTPQSSSPNLSPGQIRI